MSFLMNIAFTREARIKVPTVDHIRLPCNTNDSCGVRPFYHFYRKKRTKEKKKEL